MVDLILDEKIRLVAPFKLYKQCPELKKVLREFMVLPNPAWVEAKKHNRATWGISKNIALWKFDRRMNTLALPRGFLPELLKLFHTYNIPHRIIKDNQAAMKNPVGFKSKIKLREYQTPAVEAMVRAGYGVLVAPAGSGKTIMGMEIIAQLQQPALWLTHTQDLAEQAADAAATVLGLTEVGMVGGGRHDLGRGLTIGIIQTLTRRDLNGIAREFGTVVVDETHHGAAPTWRAVVSQLPARYRYGLTATPTRADGLEAITYRVIGPVVHTVPREAVELLGGAATARVKLIKTNCQPAVYKLPRKNVKWAGAAGMKEPTVPYGKLLSSVLNDEGRNQLIIDTILWEAPGHYTLVLSERVAHCELLVDLLRAQAPGLRIAAIHGGLSKKERYEILEQMNNGDLDILLAVDIAKEGLDIPRLDRLHIIGGGRNENEVEQKVGRVQRPFPGKKGAMIFDYIDEKIPSLKAHARDRRRVYRRLGLKIERGTKNK